MATGARSPSMMFVPLRGVVTTAVLWKGDHDVRTIVDRATDLFARVGVAGKLEDLHRTLPPRQVRAVADAVAAHLARDVELESLFDDLAQRVAAARGADEGFSGHEPLARQAAPCVRVNPPRRPDLAVPFHTDGWAGNPRPQLAIWIPLVDVAGDEGLWFVDDVDARPFRCSGTRLGTLQPAMRARARPIAVVRDDAIVFGADVGHGSVVHDIERTRVSIDLRVAPASAVRRAGWRPRWLA